MLFTERWTQAESKLTSPLQEKLQVQKQFPETAIQYQ